MLADGFSCRTQLDDLAGVRALHLAELLGRPGRGRASSAGAAGGRLEASGAEPEDAPLPHPRSARFDRVPASR